MQLWSRFRPSAPKSGQTFNKFEISMSKKDAFRCERLLLVNVLILWRKAQGLQSEMSVVLGLSVGSELLTGTTLRL